MKNTYFTLTGEENNYRAGRKKNEPLVEYLINTVKSIGVLTAATMIGLLFGRWGFTEANIIIVYILGVLIISVVTTGRIYSLASSIASVLVFNFFFTVPKFTFFAYENGYPATFLIMFTVAFISSSLVKKLKKNAREGAQAALRARVLLDTNQMLQKVDTDEEIIEATASQLIKLLDRNIIIYASEGDGIGEPAFFPAGEGGEKSRYLAEKEQEAVKWVFENNTHAGASTDKFKDARCVYLAIRFNDRVFGVVGIDLDNEPLNDFENSIMLSVLGECALALENNKNYREKEEASVMAKNEQLRADLLRTISHDLRTPLTSISGNASNLISNGDSFEEETKKAIYEDIYDDSMWLINLVENLLAVTRIEAGKMTISMSAQLMDEVIYEALNHVNKKRTGHKINVIEKDDFLLVRMDARLMVQVIINIVDNAVKYTPAGSEINITAGREEDKVVVEIADNGPGISDDDKSKIFEMFYCGNNSVADSRRSMGLGLSLCKSIVSAHGGKIEVKDNVPEGAVFRIILPAGEVEVHE